ncbi:fibronectin-binding protein (FBP) [Andreesenia angusta]|uniref:Fibronectin-binding protein (FBP) n=1 Tax=Andreesenia angusta TaxID=39480 RepID=A0A1S1VAN4_9FIRM|nr:FusB/FusC family EF-G-binding protein [Andreesenia angusta]OHW63565.1 fibronectin-binding protein (FBP) [Andreesenia angusta]
MNSFIEKHRYNYIKKCLQNLNSAFRTSVDENIINVTKAHLNEKILSAFENLTEDEKEIIDITKISDPLHIDTYLSRLDKYTFGMKSVTKSQLLKVFKKEKKLHIPDLETLEAKKVYLGWTDNSTRKMFIAYDIDGVLLGMTCRIISQKNTNSYVCALCNYVGRDGEVISVSPVCKTRESGRDTYKSIGISICKNSDECNSRISSIERLEDILKTVNGIE